MYLAPHFSLQELTVSQEADRRGLINTPPPEIIENLRQTAVLMENVRTILGDKPIIVNSAYRSPAVNQAIGGSKTSAHMLGLACDFICPKFGSPYQVAIAIRDSGIAYDQLILEYGWIHIGLPAPMRPMRRQNLTKRSSTAAYEIGINK